MTKQYESKINNDNHENEHLHLYYFVFLAISIIIGGFFQPESFQMEFRSFADLLSPSIASIISMIVCVPAILISMLLADEKGHDEVAYIVVTIIIYAVASGVIAVFIPTCIFCWIG
jgi:hypothetical protein